MNRNKGSLLAYGRETLKDAGIETYSLDALVLLSHAVNRSKEWLLSHEYSLDDKEYESYLSYIRMREKHKPVQYIINESEFMGLAFYVDENVLIPRPDTEILTEKAIEASKRLDNPKILDLCTGSGCIAISVSYYNHKADVTATDISRKAIEIAEANAEANGVSGRIRFLTGDLFAALGSEGARFNIIMSNPPYISEKEMPQLPESVRFYEPLSALNGGKDGLELYERIAREAFSRFDKGGMLLLEIGYNQAEEVSGILNRNGYNNINIYKDLAGRDRVLEAIKGENNV